MGAGKNFKVSITLSAKDSASAAIKSVAASVRGIAAAAAAPLGQLGAAFGAIGRAAGTAFGAVGRAASAIISPIVNAGKALWNFGVRIVTSVINKVRTLIKWLLLLGAAVAEEFVRRSVNAFADYEQAIVNAASVTGLMGGALAEATDELFNFGLALSRTSSKTPVEIAEAFYSLASAGLSVNEVIAATPGVLALAEGTLADMGMTAELTSSAMRAFGLEATDMDRIVNVLAASIGSSRMNMERLSVSLPYVATSAKQLGISLEQTVAALGAIVNRGLEASTAGAQFRMTLARLMSVTQEGQRVLRKYGLTVADVNVQERGLIPVLQTLKAANLGFADMQKLVGVRAATTATILKDNVGELIDMQKALTGTNRAYDMQAQQMNTVQRAYAVLKSTLQEVQIRFGKALSPALRRATDRLQEFVEGLLAAGGAEKVANWLGDMANKAMDFVDSMIASGQASAMWESLVEWAKKVANWLGEMAIGVKEFVVNMILSGEAKAMWDNLVKKVIMAYVFVKTLLPKAGKIVKGVMEFIGEWLKYGAAWVVYLAVSFYKEFPKIAATVIPILAGIAKVLLWTVGIGDAVVRMFKILTNVVGIVLTGAWYLTTGAVLLFAQALTGLFRILAKLPGVGKFFQPAVDAIDDILRPLGELRDAFGEEFLRRSKDLAKNMKDLGEAGGKFAPYHEGIKEMEEMGLRWAGKMDTSGIVVPPRPLAPGAAGGPPVTINIGGGIYGVDELDNVIQKAVGEAMRAAGYAH